MIEEKRISENDMKLVLEAQRKKLKSARDELIRWNDNDKERFGNIFGVDDEAARNKILNAVKKEIEINEGIKYQNFEFMDVNVHGRVNDGDYTHTIYLGNKFIDDPLDGRDSQVITLIHEMSHFYDVLGSFDEGLRSGGIDLAKKGKRASLQSAYNFERYFE
ncbi:hypothetical protein HmCmsJML130_01601 [Escherichia coli]|nr:hypothetical protein HmCmsJML130_01601 [Escherichia coli]